MLFKLEMWLFNKGADKGFCIWDRMGNLIQDIRTKLNK